MNLTDLYNEIVMRLERAGRQSPYFTDANETDARYFAYGVRAPEMKVLISEFRVRLNALPLDSKLELANRFLDSGFGEQKTIALHLYNQIVDYFTPNTFNELDQIVRRLHGWSKVDAYTGSLVTTVLFAHPRECQALIQQWNNDQDLWLRRASVVLFTRHVAGSGRFTSFALELCENLKNDKELLVQKGVGWCLKDLLKTDKDSVMPYILELRNQQVSSTITLYALRDIKGKERQEILKN